MTNLELVRAIYAAWGRGDFDASDWADPEIEFVIPDGLDAGSWRGVDQMRAAWTGTLSAFHGLRVEAEEIREVDEERVLVLTRNSGRGKGSGVELGEITTLGANVFHVRDGKVARLVAYWDRDRALAELGG